MRTIELKPAQPTAVEWTDWRWQQRNAVRSAERLLEIFPGLAGSVVDRIRENQQRRRLQITPYALGLIRRTADGSAPEPADPMWRQFVPFWSEEPASFGYDGLTENWEMPDEMVTPIAQHKYDNRIIVRLTNVCLSYCQFCYEALRTLEKDSTKEPFQQQHWRDTLDYIRRTPGIDEVILSGGEPLVYTDGQLERVLDDLITLDRRVLVRIHTRALTFNPFRITTDLVAAIRGKVVSFGLHVSHPHELTDELRTAVERLHDGVPIIFANIPLLKGINDDPRVMRTLGIALYSMGVIPHYLYHFMPRSPGAAVFRTSVQQGIDIINSLKRHVSNLAVPEFVIPHESGTFSPPLVSQGHIHPRRSIDEHGQAAWRYVNWRGDVVSYPDE